MPIRVIWMLVSGIMAAAILSIILKEIQWGAVVGLLVGILISEYYREEENIDDVEVDERVASNIKNVMILILSVSYVLLIIYFLVSHYILNQKAFEPLYFILYLLGTLFMAFFIGPFFIKRR